LVKKEGRNLGGLAVTKLKPSVKTDGAKATIMVNFLHEIEKD
jgi:hypothetical protein